MYFGQWWYKLQDKDVEIVDFEDINLEGATVIAYDPVAISNAKSIFEDTIEYASSSISCLKGADGCILVTEWDEFKELGPEDFKQHMKTPILIDSRRIYDPQQFSQKIRFRAIGLGKRNSLS